MSKPSFENIDRWLFEYAEGNLSPEQIANLKTFLLIHPELDVDLDAWKDSYITAEGIVLPNAEKYKKRGALIPIFATSGIAAGIIAATFLSIHLFSGSSSGVAGSSLTFAQKKINQQLADRTLRNTVNSDQFNTMNLDPRILNASLFNGTRTSQQNASPLVSEQRIIDEYNNLEANDVSDVEFTNLNPDLVSTYNSNKSSVSGSKTSSKNHNSFLKPFFRKVNRLMDNPVALKNSKDAIYQVPGMQNPQVNFGTVGTLLTSRFQAISRVQNHGYENERFSQIVSYDAYASSIRSGMGFQLKTDSYNKGAFRTYEANILYSPKFMITKNIILEPGLQLKMGQKRLTPSKINSGEMVEIDRGNTQTAFSENETPLDKKLWYKDVGLSMMFNSRWFFAGAQVDNLFRHDEGIYSSSPDQRETASRHVVLTAGTEYESQDKKLAVSPYLLYQKNGNLEESWAGANFRYKWFNVGSAISTNLEPAASIGIKTARFLLNYQADYTHSALMDKKLLSHQLTLRLLAKPSRYNRLSKL